MHGDAASAGWWTFELVPFPLLVGASPEWDEKVRDKWVPRRCVGMKYRVCEASRVIEMSSGERVVWFGDDGLWNGVCLDLDSDRVLWAIKDAYGAFEPLHVNARLGSFNECVRAVVERLPFYGEDDELEELEEVGDELAAMILAIDPTALGELTYWGSFVEDVKDGNFSTQELQGERD
jgi:hypothetical protein